MAKGAINREIILFLSDCSRNRNQSRRLVPFNRLARKHDQPPGLVHRIYSRRKFRYTMVFTCQDASYFRSWSSNRILDAEFEVPVADRKYCFHSSRGAGRSCDGRQFPGQSDTRAAQAVTIVKFRPLTTADYVTRIVPEATPRPRVSARENLRSRNLRHQRYRDKTTVEPNTVQWNIFTEFTGLVSLQCVSQ